MLPATPPSPVSWPTSGDVKLVFWVVMALDGGAITLPIQQFYYSEDACLSSLPGYKTEREIGCVRTEVPFAVFRGATRRTASPEIISR